MVIPSAGVHRGASYTTGCNRKFSMRSWLDKHRQTEERAAWGQYQQALQAAATSQPGLGDTEAIPFMVIYRPWSAVWKDPGDLGPRPPG